MSRIFDQEHMQNIENEEAIKDIRQAQLNLRAIMTTLLALGDLKKGQQLAEVDWFLDAYIKIAEAYATSCRIFSGDAEKASNFTRNSIQVYMEQARAESAKRREDLITELRKQVELYHHEAEKNLRLLNEARGIVWHSVAEKDLPAEDGTYLVVGKFDTVFITHFHKERKLTTPGYYTIPAHFGNKHVRFWANRPEPPVTDPNYHHAYKK